MQSNRHLGICYALCSGGFAALSTIFAKAVVSENGERYTSLLSFIIKNTSGNLHSVPLSPDFMIIVSNSGFVYYTTLLNVIVATFLPLCILNFLKEFHIHIYTKEEYICLFSEQFYHVLSFCFYLLQYTILIKYSKFVNIVSYLTNASH